MDKYITHDITIGKPDMDHLIKMLTIIKETARID